MKVMRTKAEVFVVTRRDEDGTAWLMNGSLDGSGSWWSGPFMARTFITQGLADYMAKRINAKPKDPQYECGPAKVNRRLMASGFKEWIRDHGA